MFKVKDYMTKNVICAEPDATISQIIDLMKEKGIHRVPVVEKGKLVGLITEGMISNSGTTNATSLSIYELNYLLSKTTVSTVMVKKVISVDENELMEYATQKMLKNNIGCLPVTNAITLYFVVLIPIASLAISSSRIDKQALPGAECVKLQTTRIAITAHTNNNGNVVNLGIPFNPAAPFVISIFCTRIRTISAKPKVAIAK